MWFFRLRRLNMACGSGYFKTFTDFLASQDLLEQQGRQWRSKVACIIPSGLIV